MGNGFALERVFSAVVIGVPRRGDMLRHQGLVEGLRMPIPGDEAGSDQLCSRAAAGDGAVAGQFQRTAG